MDSQPFSNAVRGPFAFIWHVPVDGFEIHDSVAIIPGFQAGHGPLQTVIRKTLSPNAKGLDPGPWLVRPPGSRVERQYAPLAMVNLHRRFARVNTDSRASLKRFADKHGMLTQGIPGFDLKGGTGQPLYLGEPFNFWQDEHRHVTAALELWDLVRDRAAGQLGQHIVWADESTVELRSWHGRDRIILSSSDPNSADLFAKWRFGESIEPARFYVHQQINERLRGHVTPQIFPYRDGEVLMIPDSLLGAIWLQFALEVSGRIRPAIVCKGCGIYFVPAHGSQQYHVKACRKRAYYHRQKSRSGQALHRD